MNHVLTISSAPEPDVESLMAGRRDDQNDASAGGADRQPLHVIVRDGANREVLGGISGRTSHGMLFLDLVYLPRGLRDQDLVARMVALAEEEAMRRGCRAGVLYTMNIQTPRFYERLGWRIFGEVACDPPGTSRVFLTKDLRRGARPEPQPAFSHRREKVA